MADGAAPPLLVLGAVIAYAMAALPSLPRDRGHRISATVLMLAWLMHLALLVLDIGGWGAAAPGARLGFAPVLSATVWLVIAVHTVESRFVPLPSVRIGLALAGLGAVVLAAAFPGEVRRFATPLGPLHFVLGVVSYGLFGAAVLHALLLDAAERRLKQHKGAQGASGLPLMQLERLTFRFVSIGFAVLTATLLLGVSAPTPWRWEHKTVFALLAWVVFAALLGGRHLRGWRGRRATRWVYIGAALLLLAYVGSRFVLEVLLGRSLS
jgi:ABC-type uncharacterized transport system permease subunit